MRRTLCEAFGLVAILLAVLGLASTALAQQPVTQTAEKDQPTSDTIQAINGQFDQQHQEVERQRLEALSELASEQSGEEAEATYRHLFSRAIVDGRTEGAEEAAKTYLQKRQKEKGKGEPQTLAMAAFIATSAAASRDEPDQAIAILSDFLKESDSERLDSELLYGLGELFLQRLILDDKPDAARKTCQLFAEGPFDEEMKSHFQAVSKRLEMLGQAAPAIQARDIDGEAINLDDLKGRVVLVEFWASWCPPCLAAIPRLNALQDRYQDEGLTILGVNVDAKQPGTSPEEVRSQVRSLLIDFLVPWQVILNGEGDQDLTASYGVTEIPASFLIDQEGRVARVELNGPSVEQALVELLGVEAEAEASAPPIPEKGVHQPQQQVPATTEPLPDSGVKLPSPRRE